MNTNPKIEHLKPHKWQKGNPSPNKLGRPKSLKKILSDECNLTPTQSNYAILNLLMHTKSEIEYICNDDTQPMFFQIIAKSLLKNYNTGSLYVLESLLNRTHGMPGQQTETTTQEKPIFVSFDLDVR